MFNSPSTCAAAASTSPEALQRRRIASRVNVSRAVADLLAMHAFGPPRDAFVVIAAAPTFVEAAR